MSTFAINPEKADMIRWNRRGSCGQSGCTDPECCCALCGKPVGVPEDDPRWQEHSEFCIGCELCEDEVPLMLFRGEGKQMEQAKFHKKCFREVTSFEQKRKPARVN